MGTLDLLSKAAREATGATGADLEALVLAAGLVFAMMADDAEGEAFFSIELRARMAGE